MIVKVDLRISYLGRLFAKCHNFLYFVFIYFLRDFVKSVEGANLDLIFVVGNIEIDFFQKIKVY